MTRDDILVTVFARRSAPGVKPFPPLRGSLEIRPADRRSLKGLSPSRATYVRIFSVGPRYLEVVVHAGARQPPPSFFADANAVLRKLRAS